MNSSLKTTFLLFLSAFICFIHSTAQRTSLGQYYRSLNKEYITQKKFIPINCTVDFYEDPNFRLLSEDLKVDIISDSKVVTTENLLVGNHSLLLPNSQPIPVQDYWHQGKKWRVFLNSNSYDGGKTEDLTIVSESNQKFVLNAARIKWSFFGNELWLSGGRMELDWQELTLITVLDLTSFQSKEWKFRPPSDQLKIENIHHDYHHIWFKTSEKHKVNEKWFRFSKVQRGWEAVPQLKGNLCYVDSTYLYMRYESIDADTCFYIIYNKSGITSNKLPDWSKLYEERAHFRALLGEIEKVERLDDLVGYLELAENKFSSLRTKEPELHAKVYQFASARLEHKPRSLGRAVYERYKSGQGLYSKAQFEFYLSLVRIAIVYGDFQEAVALIRQLQMLKPYDPHNYVGNSFVIAAFEKLISDIAKLNSEPASDLQLYKTAQLLKAFFDQHRNESFFAYYQDWTDWTVAMAYWKLLREYPQSPLLKDASQQLESTVKLQQAAIRKNKVYLSIDENFNILKELTLLEDFARIEHPTARPFFLYSIAANIADNPDYSLKEEFVPARKAALNKALNLLNEIKMKYNEYSFRYKYVSELSTSIKEELAEY